MKMTVKCLTLDYDSVFLQSLELVVFKRRRNGAICSELALALRNLSLGTAMQELIQCGVMVGVGNVLLNVQIFTEEKHIFAYFLSTCLKLIKNQYLVNTSSLISLGL